MRNFQKNNVEEIKLHILRSVIVFFENCVFYAIITQNLYDVEKYFTVGQATGDNMAHAHSMLDT